jgi:hypothetical protein
MTQLARWSYASFVLDIDLFSAPEALHCGCDNYHPAVNFMSPLDAISVFVAFFRLAGCADAVNSSPFLLNIRLTHPAANAATQQLSFAHLTRSSW